MAKKAGLGNVSGGKTGKKLTPWNNVFNPLSEASKRSNLNPFNKDGNNKNPMWNNYLNPLSQKVLDLRADSSGTSSVGRTRRKKEEEAARIAEAARNKALAQATFDARFPGGPGWRTSPGFQVPWPGQRQVNPGLPLRRFNTFESALSPTTTV